MQYRPLTIDGVVSDPVLDEAFTWLCKQRKDWPAEADVWDLRRQWPEEKERLREELLTGRYQVSLLTRVTIKNQDEVDLWAARDAVVMKALTLVLQRWVRWVQAGLPSPPQSARDR